MICPRCGGEMTRTVAPWCSACERQYDTWVRRHATDILWQSGLGAGVAMVIALGLPLLGFEPVLATIGVLVGASTFFALRRWGNRRRRQQFIVGALPRAYLPSKS